MYKMMKLAQDFSCWIRFFFCCQIKVREIKTQFQTHEKISENVKLWFLRRKYNKSAQFSRQLINLYLEDEIWAEIASKSNILAR